MMNKKMQKMIALCSLVLLLVSMVVIPNEAEAASEFYGNYTDVANIVDYGSCGIMQGMAVGSQKLYTVKINSDDTQAVIYMTDKDSGDTVKLYNSDASSYYFTNLGHANDMDVWGFDSKSHLFVATTKKGSNAIVRLKRDGTNLTKVASYKLTCGGSEISASAISIIGVTDGVVNFITKTGTQVYRGTLNATAANATIEMTKLCSISKSRVYIKGEYLDLSDYTNQGMGYLNGMLYVPIWADSAQPNRSVIMVFNMDGLIKGSTIYPSDAIVFRVTSSAYPALCEIESCDVTGGKLYFNTNRRKTASDTNHDAVSEMKDYTFVKLTEPAKYQHFTVQYNANGGTGTMEDTVVPYGVNTKLRSNTFTKNGSKFVGWTCYRTEQKQWRYTNGTDDGWYAEGSQPSGYTKSIYKNAVSVAKTTSVDGDVVVMHAQWEPSTYTVRYDANGGAGTMEDTQVTYGVATNLRANAFTRENYTFAGWNAYRTTNGQWNYKSDDGGSGWYAEGSQPAGYYKATYNDKHSVSKTTGIDGDLVIMYAQWESTGHVITFQNADGTELQKTVVEPGSVPVPPDAPSQAPDRNYHYTFAGWDQPLAATTGDTVFTATYTATAHSFSTVVNKQESCTEGGSKTHTCNCGYSATETVAATGHNYKEVVTAPTCTAAGYSTYTCSNCGDSYTGSIIDAVGHSYTSTVTEPSCTSGGYTTFTCVHCGEVKYGNYTDAAGHNYSPVVTNPTCTSGGYTTYTCDRCRHSYQDHITSRVEHNFVYGVCSNCSAADPNYVSPLVKPTLTLKSPTLEFKDMICIVAFYTAENTQDVVEMGMITYSSKVAEWNVDTAEHVIPGAEYDEISGRYYSASQGIHAKYLADTVYLACYAKLSDGTYVYTRLAPYSPIQYANSQLKNSTDPKLKQLVVAMLNYGTEAQLYFGHNTGSLANAALTTAQKTLPEAYRADMVSTVVAAPAEKQGIFANNKGFVTRKPAISFEGAFCINYFFTPAYTPTGSMILYYWNAEDYNAANVLSTVNATGNVKMEGSGIGEYRGDITGISAKNLSEAVYVAAVYKSGDTVWTSGVLGYSIGAYCSSQASKGGDVADLAMATAVYGYHAKQYFGQ